MAKKLTDEGFSSFVDWVYEYHKHNPNLTWKQLCDGLKDGEGHDKDN